MRVEPATAHYTVEESDSFLGITIRAAGRRGPAFAQGLILVLASLGLLCFLPRSQMLTSDLAFVPILGALLVLLGVLFGVYRIAWWIAGHERITVTTDQLVQTIGVGSLVRTRRHAVVGLTHLHIPLENGAQWAEFDAYQSGLDRGIIQFDYQGRRRRIGHGLNVPEAQAILALLVPRLARH